MKIAVDAMGGDYAPEEIVLGAVEAVKAYDFDVVLVGDEKKIRGVLTKYGAKESDRLSIVHASEVIEMGEHPAQAIRRKKDASIVVATRLVKDGLCDAVVAAGSTGAAVTAALFGLGRIKGIERPCIATPIPSKKGITVLLDSGANANSKPKHLVEGAIMGYHYAKYILGVEKPTVGLLNIGEEKEKGNLQTKATYELMENTSDFNFVGNVEAKHVFDGTVADVVVCDGFVGNTLLKVMEGIYEMARKQGLVNDNYFTKLNYENVGGTPVLGINSTVIIGHGCSNANAIANMVLQTEKTIKAGVAPKLREIFNK